MCYQITTVRTAKSWKHNHHQQCLEKCALLKPNPNTKINSILKIHMKVTQARHCHPEDRKEALDVSTKAPVLKLILGVQNALWSREEFMAEWLAWNWFMNALQKKQTTLARDRQDSREIVSQDAHQGTQELSLGNLPNRFVSDSQDLALGFWAKTKFYYVTVVCEIGIIHIFVGCREN